MAARRGLGALLAVCGLVLTAQVGTAKAAVAPQPPVIPTVPPIAVQVSVSIPAVSVNVQVGTVDISVTTASVDVSVSVSSEGSVSSTDATSTPTPTTQADAASNCCEGQATAVAPQEEVAPPATSAKATPAPPPAKPRPRPTLRAAANRVPDRAIRIPRAAHPRVPAATQVPIHTSERRGTRPRPPPSCCEDAQARFVIAGHVKRLPRSDREGALVRAAALPVEQVKDNRLLLQLGMLGAFLYLVSLAGWFSVTRLRQGRA